MWWDDSGVFLSPPDDQVDASDRKVLADKLLAFLIRVLQQGNEQAQLAAIHGLDCLEHPQARHALRSIGSGVQLTSQVRDALNGLSGD
jgi:hypothetical protein